MALGRYGARPATSWRGRYDPGLAQIPHLHPEAGYHQLEDSGGFARPSFRCAPVGLLRTPTQRWAGMQVIGVVILNDRTG